MDKFCRACGCPHTATAYPMKCPTCFEVTYVNPTPVAVLLQPIYLDNGVLTRRHGVLIGKRGHGPKQGEWGLIGGFAECGDLSIEASAARECLEETGLDVSPEEMWVSHSFGNGRQMMFFVHNPKAIAFEEAMDLFVPSPETPVISVAWRPRDLCFDSHTAALARWYEVPTRQYRNC